MTTEISEMAETKTKSNITHFEALLALDFIPTKVSCFLYCCSSYRNQAVDMLRIANKKMLQAF